MNDIQFFIAAVAVFGLVLAFLLASRSETLPEPIPQPVCKRCKEFISFERAADPDWQMLCKDCAAKEYAAWEFAQSKR